MMKKIIVVDDVHAMLFRLQKALKGKYEVYPAQTETILFEILEQIIPDLILLDVNMPGLGGFGIMKKLTENPRFAYIPVIFLTGTKTKNAAITGLSLGAVDFITKPITDEKLIESIEKQLNADFNKVVKPIILAVDDSPVILESLNGILSGLYNVYTLPFPERIHQVLSLVVPDLFILDYHMPKLTGFELIPIIRDYPDHEDTPIMFLTTEATVENVTLSAYLGVADYLIKPIDETLLHIKVSQHLKGFMNRRRIREFSG